MSKNPDAFRTISEVAEELELPQHVLRFWETRFTQIKPMKRRGGRRYYRPDDVDLLRGIKALLYEEGYTIRGVQRLLKEQGNRLAVDFGKGQPPSGILVDPVEITEPEEVKSVSEVVQEEKNKPKKQKGLLGRIASQFSEDEDAASIQIHGNDLRTLQATLQDLLECKRLLDQTRQS